MHGHVVEPSLILDVVDRTVRNQDERLARRIGADGARAVGQNGRDDRTIAW